jgi:hypothetical protein
MFLKYKISFHSVSYIVIVQTIACNLSYVKDIQYLYYKANLFVLPLAMACNSNILVYYTAFQEWKHAEWKKWTLLQGGSNDLIVVPVWQVVAGMLF